VRDGVSGARRLVVRVAEATSDFGGEVPLLGGDAGGQPPPGR
jgi:hypothetical protein